MKNEPLFKELRALLSTIRARAELRRVEREADRIAAGTLTKEEQRAERERWNA
jgi:hypothetical protein